MLRLGTLLTSKLFACIDEGIRITLFMFHAFYLGIVYNQVDFFLEIVLNTLVLDHSGLNFAIAL